MTSDSSAYLTSHTTVRDVMRPPTTTVEPEAHLAAAAYLIKHFDDSALVVTTEDTHEPVAMITDSEITQAVADGLKLEETRISDIVRTRPVTVDVDALAVDAERLMLTERVRHLPVVDGKRLVGIVELSDLRAFHHAIIAGSAS